MYEETTSQPRPKRIERSSYDPDGRDSLTVAIAEAVARAKGISPSQLKPRVYDAIDPEALEQLFQSGSASPYEAEVRFPMAGYTVVVKSNGEIVVTAGA